MHKLIYILIGQKGAGKSFIGALMEEMFGIKFVRVEDWAKQIHRGRNVEDQTYIKEVFLVIEEGIRSVLETKDQIVFESTGLSDYFDQMLENLRNDFRVCTIGIRVKEEVCLERVKTRDQTIHINISDDHVNRINQQVRVKNVVTDFTIENEHKTKEQLTKEIRDIIQEISF